MFSFAESNLSLILFCKIAQFICLPPSDIILFWKLFFSCLWRIILSMYKFSQTLREHLYRFLDPFLSVTPFFQVTLQILVSLTSKFLTFVSSTQQNCQAWFYSSLSVPQNEIFLQAESQVNLEGLYFFISLLLGFMVPCLSMKMLLLVVCLVIL